MRRCVLAVLMLLTACTGILSQPDPPASSAPELLTVRQLLSSAPPSGPVVVIGYLYADPAGAILVDGLSFSGSSRPQPVVTDAAQQIWLGKAIDAALDADLQRSDGIGYEIVQAHGELDGPGSFGPSGTHRYQLTSTDLTARSAEELTIAALLADTASYENEVVRIEGDLVASSDSAILVEAVGVGGVPDSNSLQIKLLSPIRDQALLQSLSSLPGTPVRFGPVQIVGLWQRGTLHPFAIITTSTER